MFCVGLICLLGLLFGVWVDWLTVDWLIGCLVGFNSGVIFICFFILN